MIESLIIKQPKWSKYANFWYQCTYKNQIINLRWFKDSIAVAVDGGDWMRHPGQYKLWEAKSKALVIVENFLSYDSKDLK